MNLYIINIIILDEIIKGVDYVRGYNRSIDIYQVESGGSARLVLKGNAIQGNV